jgi:hypothetical protein
MLPFRWTRPRPEAFLRDGDGIVTLCRLTPGVTGFILTPFIAVADRNERRRGVGNMEIGSKES